MEEFWVVCVCVYTLPFDPSMQRQGIVGSSFSLSKGQKIFGLVLVCIDEEQSGTYI